MPVTIEHAKSSTASVRNNNPTDKGAAQFTADRGLAQRIQVCVDTVGSLGNIINSPGTKMPQADREKLLKVLGRTIECFMADKPEVAALAREVRVAIVGRKAIEKTIGIPQKESEQLFEAIKRLHDLLSYFGGPKVTVTQGKAASSQKQVSSPPVDRKEASVNSIMETLGFRIEDHTRIGFGWGGRVKSNEGATIIFVDRKANIYHQIECGDKLTRIGDFAIVDAKSCKAALEKYRGRRVPISIVESGFLGFPGKSKTVAIDIPS